MFSLVLGHSSEKKTWKKITVSAPKRDSPEKTPVTLFKARI